MGQQVTCTVQVGDAISAGVAQLETDELRFRGEVRLQIPFAEIESLEVVDGTLVVVYPRGVARFELGSRAAKWAEAIRNPKSRIHKLDVKPGLRVALVGMTDAEFLSELRGRVPDALVGCAPPSGDEPFDLLFLGAEQESDLEHIPALAARLRPPGGLWVVAPKGRRHLTELDVLLAGRAAGLKDIKVARFSVTHTARKFVIPRERR